MNGPWGHMYQQTTVASVPRIPRDIAVDRYRGALMLLMAGGNYLGGITWVSSVIKHTPDVGFTIADAVAPCFVFAMGLTYGPSFARRSERSLTGAYLHFVQRYFAFIGIGALLTAGGTAVAGQPTTWGVLQALGMAGLVCLPVIRVHPLPRAAVALAILGGYHIGMRAGWQSSVFQTVQGGFFGGIAWGALLILSTALADLRRQGTLPFLGGILVTGLIASLSMLVIPVSKNRVSVSYLLLTLTIGAAMFLLVDVISRWSTRPGPLSWWGENPLLLYIVHLLVLGIYTIPPVPGWYANVPAWLAIVQLGVMLVIMQQAARMLHQRHVIIKL